MKLCPQCDFLYEDDQSVCDMDGNALVLRAPAESRFRLTIPINPPDSSALQQAGVPKSRRSSSIIVATVVVLVLATLVVVAYVARSRARSAQPLQAVSPTARTSAQPATDQSSVSQPASDQTATASDQSTESSTSPEELAQSDSSKVSLAHSRLNPEPVSASATNGRGPVVVRLTNGTGIKADDAWEKREGIWYRQGGMVTFLNRSQVRSIERAPAPPRSQSTTTSVAGRNSSQGGAVGDRNQTRSREQLRLARLEPVNQKKESRVTSFFKKTGNLIKKPFQR